MVMSAKAFGPLPMMLISLIGCVSFSVFNQIAVFYKECKVACTDLYLPVGKAGGIDTLLYS